MDTRNNRRTILIVDDEPTNIKTLAASLQADYEILAATSGEEALRVAIEHPQLSLILLDIIMPEMDGYEVCAQLRITPRTHDIPIIFITAKVDDADEARGLELGAVDYISKPICPPTVRARVRTQIELKNHREYLDDLVRERTAALLATRKDLIHRLAVAAEYRDTDTGAHIFRMSKYCETLAKLMGQSDSECETLANASTMHDIGKIGIPDNILNKPGKLTDEERNTMQEHAMIGGRILADPSCELMRMAYDIAISHHEKWDGTGYPNGLAGKDIPFSARIAAICDVFDALTTTRPYKDAWPIEKALALLKNERGAHFDPALVDVFLENIAEFIEIKERYPEREPVNS